MKFITKPEFEAWLAKYPDDALPCADLPWCPLVVAMGGVPDVLNNGYWKESCVSSASPRHRLQRWARQFVRQIDDLDDGCWDGLTAAQMREALR